jgi:VWFA-related protein
MQRLLPLIFFPALSVAVAQAPAQQPAPSQPVPTIKAGTQIVIVDVVVTDSKGHPVHDLKASDFVVLENNVSQPIRHFEEHTAITAAEAAKLPPMPRMPPGIYTNYTPAAASGAVNVLLLDTLNTPMKDQSFVREQLKQYLKSAPPGTRMAIFGLTSRLYLLQGFTSDPEILKTVLNQKDLKSSPLLNDPVNGGNGPESMSDMMSDSMGNDPSAAQVTANLQQFEAEQQSFQLQLRARYTLDAMNQLARYLSGIPGRKNLIWFSGSFPISVLPDGDLQNPFAVVADFEDEFRETTNLLAVSQVAVYPVDARGLMVSPNLSVTNSGSKYVRSPNAFAKDEAKFFQQNAAEHSTMLQMSEQTGGHAYINTNGLSQAVASAIDSGSNFYTLTYSPGDTNWNGKFRKIQVHLHEQGLTLAYRRGYYADDPNAPPKHKQPVAATTTSAAPVNAMHAAMMRGGPDPTQVIFKVLVRPATATTEDTLAPDNALNPAAKVKPPYRRYTIDFAVNPRDISFTRSPEGNYQGDIQFLTYLYDQDGNLFNISGTTVKANLPPTAYAASLRTGLQYHQEISVPVKGVYFFRIGIHDVNGDHVGAIEIPVAVVSKVPPADAPAVLPAKAATSGK